MSKNQRKERLCQVLLALGIFLVTEAFSIVIGVLLFKAGHALWTPILSVTNFLLGLRDFASAICYMFGVAFFATALMSILFFIRIAHTEDWVE